jgi:hypothetical protein
MVQLGVATEPLNRRWYEKKTGQVIKDVQSWATLDGTVEGSGAVFEAKFRRRRSSATRGFISFFWTFAASESGRLPLPRYPQ